MPGPNCVTIIALICGLWVHTPKPGPMCSSIHVEVRTQSRESELSFYHLVPRTSTGIARFGGKCPYPLFPPCHPLTCVASDSGERCNVSLDVSLELLVSQVPCLLSFLRLTGVCRVCLMAVGFGSGSRSFRRPCAIFPGACGSCLVIFLSGSVSRGVYPGGIVTGPELLMWSL